MDLQDLINLLSQQAGPKGSTFAGRVVPQGEAPGLRELMTRLPTESPDAEGMGAMGVIGAGGAGGAAGTLLLPKPKPFMKLGKYPGTPFEGQAYKYTLPVRVTLESGDTFIDAVKGLNRGHAMERARANWEGAGIVPLKR